MGCSICLRNHEGVDTNFCSRCDANWDPSTQSVQMRIPVSAGIECKSLVGILAPVTFFHLGCFGEGQNGNSKLLVFRMITLHQDRVCAKTMVDVVREVAVHELQHMRYYDGRPPYAYVAMLAKDMRVRQDRLQWMKELQEALEILDALAARDPWFREYRRDMIWPHHLFDRKVLVGAMECGFDGVPCDIEQELQHIARGMNDSVVNEEGFRVLNSSARTHTAGFLGRASRYHRLLVSGLDKDYDRSPVAITSMARAAKPADLTKETFECPSGDKTFSLGSEVFKKFGDKKAGRDYQNPGEAPDPQENDVPFAFALALIIKEFWRDYQRILLLH